MLPAVLVDDSAEDSAAPDQAVGRRDRCRLVVGRMLVQALVRSMVVEVLGVLGERSHGVEFPVEQQPVGALRADAAHPPLREAIRLRRSGRDLDDVDAFGGEHGVERVAELRVPVADQEPERPDPLPHILQEVTGLLGRPPAGRVRVHTQDVDPSGSHLHDEQHVQPAQVDRVDAEEVGCQQPCGLGS
jgi:hypothetical protein